MLMRCARRVFRRPKRIDHGRTYMCVIMGMLFWSLSLLMIGPVPNSTIDELSDYVQNILAASIFVGSFVCCVGCLTGTMVCLPKADVRLSYKFALWGIPAIAGSVGTYVWAIIHDSGNGTFWTSVCASSMSMFVCIGIVWNGLDLVFEIKRLGEEIQYLKHGDMTSDTDETAGDCDDQG